MDSKNCELSKLAMAKNALLPSRMNCHISCCGPNPTIYEIELSDELAGAFFWALEARLQAILRAM